MGRAISVDLGVIKFRTKYEARGFFQRMLNSYEIGQHVSKEHTSFLKELLKRHPESAQKIGPGVDHFEVLSADFSTQCFYVFRVDGSFDNFSLHACIDQK